MIVLQRQRQRYLRLSRHKKRCRGVTALEFALIAPVFLLLLMGATEMSLILMAQHLMENATFNTSRLAKTGYTENGQTQQETLTAKLNTELQSMGSLIDITKVTMTATSYASLSQIGQPEQGQEGFGTAQQVAVYRVTYPWRVFTPLLAHALDAADSQITLSSRIVVRNEPY